MAIYFRGLDIDETISLTSSMVNSGDIMDLSRIKGIKVDKHSTGGVGDKTSLVLGPLVASAGVKFAKLSGRGLGHTGGTIDKLESISGFKVEMSEEKFVNSVNQIGIAIGAQTKNIVPADRKIYALRDVTATIENISLIAASIMSKKIAAGGDAIVLDVKTGDGSFMKDIEQAKELAKLMVYIGNKMHRPTVALISNMDQPLGNTIGNSIEVIEAVETLKGNGPEDLIELCIELGSEILIKAGVSQNNGDAKKVLKDNLANGKAFNKFKEFIAKQGGDVREIDDLSKLPHAKYNHDIIADKDGYLSQLKAKSVGITSMLLGAGRENKDSVIDLSAGIYLYKKTGDKIIKGDKLATLYTNSIDKLEPAINNFKLSFTISQTLQKKPELILERIT